jgi:hypothetical protein
LSTRGKWQGAATIARLNWPYYAAAVAVLAGALWAASRAPGSLTWLVCAAAVAGAFWFLAGSLVVSHLVYDRSELYRFGWLGRIFLTGVGRRRLILCHAGFDDFSPVLKELLPAEWTILDHYDPVTMTEVSIRRARRYFPPSSDTVPAVFDRWPVASASADMVFGFLAIHELRSEEERSRWFAEAKRSLRGGGVVVLAEHLRDAANFLAFGPGFWHFHTRAGWQRSWERAGLRVIDEFPVTPWVRIFALAPS